MRRLRLLLTALTLTLTWNAHALSISLDANLLKDANGNAMPTTGLVMLVASTNDSTFNAPTPLNFVTGDDVIIAKWDLTSANSGGFDTPGVLSAFINTIVPVNSSNPLKLYWYPTLNFNSTAPGQNTPYGTYTDPVGIDGSTNWFGDSPSATITLRFLTTDANTGFDFAGSNPPSAGIANQVTPTPIVINSQPANNTQNLGGTANFSIDASGASLTYQWRKNGVNLTDGVNITGAATANLTLSSVSASDVASYSVVITNSSAAATSSSATLTVIDPSISSQPTSTTVNATGTANFSVTANGTGSLTYQWKKAGSNLSNGTQGSGSIVSGATTSAVTISGVQQSDAANYTVVVTGTGGSITSSPAALTVTDVAPVFSTPTVDSTTTQNAGATVVLNAAATGSNPITYQWKKGASNLSDGAYANGATLSGATTGSLTLSGLLASDAGVYTCNAHNSVNDSLSHSTTINVNDPIITVQPDSFTAGCGDPWPCLSVTAIGSTNLTYQWYTPGPSGTAIPNATNATLCFNDNSFASAGSYSVVVSNGFGNSITSAVATVTVFDTTAPNVSLVGTSPVNICQGSSYSEQGATATDACDGTVAVTPSGTVNPNILGAYTITYTATDSHGNTGIANRIVNVQNCVTSDPAINTQPLAQVVVVGQKNVSLSVVASGTATLRYQWYKEGTGVIKGKTNSVLTFAPIALSSGGTYYCIVSNTLSIAESTHAGLTIFPTFNAACTPATSKKTAGNTAVFKTTVSPPKAVDPSQTPGSHATYQWLKNGSPISAGGNISIVDTINTSVLTITDVQNPDAATYQCIVSNVARLLTTTNTHGILIVNADANVPVANILHPSPNLRFTNGILAYVGGGITQTNIAPELDIDGRATDNGLITNVALVRIVPPNSLSNNVALTYRKTAAGATLPGSVLWTNHVTLLPGTNTFIAIASDSGTNNNVNNTVRTYYFLTNCTVTINVIGSGKVTGTASSFGKPVQGVNTTLFNNIGYKITATPVGTGKHFNGFTDPNNNTISSTSPLLFTATNGMVINANFTP